MKYNHRFTFDLNGEQYTAHVVIREELNKWKNDNIGCRAYTECVVNIYDKNRFKVAVKSYPITVFACTNTTLDVNKELATQLEENIKTRSIHHWLGFHKQDECYKLMQEIETSYNNNLNK